MAAVLRAGPADRRLQWMSLLILAVQNASLTLLMKHSRTGSDGYRPCTVVCTVEVVKMVTAMLLETVLSQGFSLRRAFIALADDIIGAPWNFLRLSVPAVLYAIQNNLCYLALGHLSALSYQVIYQMKILTTALFSMALLGKRLGPQHWTALLLLTAGVIAAQLTSSQGFGGGSSEKANPWLGFVVLLGNSISSGYAGVYFEQLSKSRARSSSRPRSLWLQSVQLGLLALPCSLAVILFSSDRDGIIRDGFFHGYTKLTWIIIALQAIGGLLVAVVIRYADNIQKAFATSLSIVLCSLVSAGVLGHSLPMGLLVGACLVAGSVVLYAKAEARAESKRQRTRSRLPRSRGSVADLPSAAK